MKNKITNLKISNFKSIKDAELECGRINLFVGKPNVGKSNVLEAMSLLGASYSKSEKFMNDFIRYEEMSNWFFDQKTDNKIVIETNIGTSVVISDYINNWFQVLNGSKNIILDETKKFSSGSQYTDEYDKLNEPAIGALFVSLRSNGDQNQPTRIYSSKQSPVKMYMFHKTGKINERDRSFLIPPDGKNLLPILMSNNDLLDEVQTFFEEYDLKLIFDTQKGIIEILKELSRSAFTKYPYISIADTLQRIIFHYAAIFSNKDSVILFEEPESHSFPPYIRDLALKIIESTENQYFITTHSPYLFDTILENTPPEDLALFVAYFENYETKFKKLNDEEISKIMDYGLDVFANLNHFVNE